VQLQYQEHAWIRGIGKVMKDAATVVICAKQLPGPLVVPITAEIEKVMEYLI